MKGLVGIGNTGHFFQSHDQLGISRIHIHVPDARPTWGVLVLVNVVNADIIGSGVLHSFEVVFRAQSVSAEPKAGQCAEPAGPGAPKSSEIEI